MPKLRFVNNWLGGWQTDVHGSYNAAEVDVPDELMKAYKVAENRCIELCRTISKVVDGHEYTTQLSKLMTCPDSIVRVGFINLLDDLENQLKKHEATAQQHWADRDKIVGLLQYANEDCIDLADKLNKSQERIEKLSREILDSHANHMDAPNGPRCACGLPSAYESGVCNRCRDLNTFEFRNKELEKLLDEVSGNLKLNKLNLTSLNHKCNAYQERAAMAKQRLKEARKDVKQLNKSNKHLIGQLDGKNKLAPAITYKNQAKEIAGWLKRYGRHKPGCSLVIFRSDNCNCGLSNLVKRICNEDKENDDKQV